MTSTGTSRPLQLAAKIFLAIGVVSLFWIVLTMYAKSSLQKWSNEQQIEMSAEKWNIKWHATTIWVVFKNVTIKNQIAWDSFQKLYINEMAMEIKPFTMLRNYFRFYEIFTHCKGVRLEEKSKSYTTIKQCNFRFVGDYPFYKIREIKTEMIDIALTQEYTNIPDNPENQPIFSHLFLYSIVGDIQYQALEQILKLDLHIPRAINQMPDTATYEVHAHGDLHLLDMPFPLPPKKTPIPIKGLIKITINNFSHFLIHLYQARIISGIVENLGSIVGYPVSKEDLRLANKEIFTNAVTLNLNVQTDAIGIGGFKVYP